MRESLFFFHKRLQTCCLPIVIGASVSSTALCQNSHLQKIQQPRTVVCQRHSSCTQRIVAMRSGLHSQTPE